MAVNPPPIQEKTSNSFGVFPQVWIRWLLDITNCVNDLAGGAGTDGIMDGGRRTTGSAIFDGGRRV